MSKLDGKIALVTGGTTGIGLATGHCQINANQVEIVILGSPGIAQNTCDLLQLFGD